MREIHVDQIRDAVAELCIKANCLLPEDFFKVLRSSAENEPSPVGRDVLCQLVENAEIAAARHVTHLSGYRPGRSIC